MNVHGLRATHLRAGLIAVSLLLPLALGTAGAHAACSEPELEIAKTNAQAGDTVAFSITGATPGTEYLLKVGDSELNAGTASATTVSDSFKMPDFGAKGRQANVQAVLAHEQCENSPWKLVQPITYRVPAAKKKAAENKAIQKAIGGPPGAKEIANLKAQRAKERRAALKRERALKAAIKKRQAAAKRRGRAQKLKAKAAQEKQRQAAARRKKELEQALRRRQRQQQAKQDAAKKPNAQTTNDAQSDRGGSGDSSKAFIALGALYVLIGGLGGAGYLLYRRSGRDIPMSRREAEAVTPLIPQFGETTGGDEAPLSLGGKGRAPARLAAGDVELEGEPATSQPEELAAATPSSASEEPTVASPASKLDGASHAPGLNGERAASVSDKDKLEAELSRVLTDAGIDAELEGIVADAQAEAARRGVPMNADLMMQLLCDEVDSSAKLTGTAEGELRSKLQEIVAEEKERVALQHPEG